MSAPTLIPDSRRHDLDALRAVAMLLGIGLHAAISFIPGDGFWAVTDTQTNEFFGLFLASIHGFRMPLFFLISGFFTMMLFRRRGLRPLLKHRFRRIFLPMVLALFTIIPAVWIVSGYAEEKIRAETAAPVAEPQIDIHLAAAHGNIDQIAHLLDDGIDLNSRNHDGVTPVMVAALFGRNAAAELLIDRGADLTIRGNKGETIRDMLKVDHGTTQWIGGMIGVEVDRQAMNTGRQKIAAILTASISGTIAADSGTPETRQDSMSAVDGLVAAGLYFPLFGHLWFLWFLCWLVAGFAVCVGVGRAAGIPGMPGWLTLSSVNLLWLVPLTMIPQSFMGHDRQAFGPDTSIGLIPMPAVLAYYAIFFTFGALYSDARDDAGTLGRRWPITLPLAAFVLLPIGLATGHQSAGPGRWTSVFAQATFAWLVSFGMMGMFRRFLSAESKVMRYLSDSSYWLYLAHVPLVIWLQYMVRHYNVSPFLKFPIVCVVAGIVLLASYQWLVRYTPIGTLLNGKRTRRPPEAIDEAEPAGGIPGQL